MAAQANPFTENLGRHRYPVSSSCMTGQKDDRDERFRLVFDTNLSRVVDYAHRRVPAHDADDVVSNGRSPLTALGGAPWCYAGSTVSSASASFHRTAVPEATKVTVWPPRPQAPAR